MYFVEQDVKGDLCFGAQKGSELHWHPSMISPALLRQAEAWSGGELVSNPSGPSAQIMTSHSGHHFVLPDAAEVAASIGAESHPASSAALGGNAAGKPAAGATQATSNLRH